MKIMTILVPILMLSVGCTLVQTEPDYNPSSSDYTPPDRKLKGGVRTKTLSEEVRRELDVNPDDFVLAVKQDGSKILYQAKERTVEVVVDEAFPIAVDERLPKDKILQNKVVIYSLKGSPTCSYYWDNQGNKVWYPKPDCPH